MLPAPEYEYAGQSLHVDADVAAEAGPYVPAEHSVHAVLGRDIRPSLSSDVGVDVQ